ncbi:hypothetical protein M0802_008936 [Mischocyttarus mexicanus]|nr:hypothetical protein M0802_008936 [Mischocyttarus mexicanus]
MSLRIFRKVYFDTLEKEADNPGVTAGVVARDALGLIRQDVSGRHSELLADLLDLIRYLTLSGPPSERTELQGSPLPIALLPVFFTLKPVDLMKWKQVAARFNELITEAPKQLRINENRCFESTTISRPNENNPNEIQQETQPEGSTRLSELPVLCPFIRFTDNYNRFNAGEMAHSLAAPLHWPTTDRLHPLISHTNRQIRSNV